ncbi:hypothetical protein EFL79_10455 [Weissella confusa]|nr:hypothetical protein [Weissella confusa]
MGLRRKHLREFGSKTSKVMHNTYFGGHDDGKFEHDIRWNYTHKNCPQRYRRWERLSWIESKKRWSKCLKWLKSKRKGTR